MDPSTVLPNRTKPNRDRRMGRMDRMTGWWMLVINSMKRRLTNVWCLCVISISITIRSTMNHILQSSRSLSFVSVNFFFFAFFRRGAVVCVCVARSFDSSSAHGFCGAIYLAFAFRNSVVDFSPGHTAMEVIIEKSIRNHFPYGFPYTIQSLWWPNWMLRPSRRAKTIFMLFDSFAGFLS